MRRAGTVFMVLGAFVGVLMALALGAGSERFGLSWVVWVGMVKLGLAGSVGLMAAGAFLRRAARRRQERIG